MITVKVEDKEYQLATNYGEIKWPTYVNLSQLKLEKFIVPELYVQRFIEILCGVDEGVFDEMEYTTIAELSPVISEGLHPKKLEDIEETTDHFVINGVTYSFYSPNSISTMKIGEHAYVKKLEMDSNEPLENQIMALAVLIRPATQITTTEGLKKWKLEPFDRTDLAHRAKILEENLSVRDLIMVKNFFTYGITT